MRMGLQQRLLQFGPWTNGSLGQRCRLQPALSHRVLGTLKKGQGRFLRSSNFLLFLLDFLDLSMEARVLSGPRFLLDFPP
jgi:hypothetical protein